MIEIVIEGPGKNALGSELMASLQSQLDAAQGAPVLFTGAGDAFSAGLNLAELLELDAAGMEGFLRQLGDLVATLFDYPGPTVAHVNGHAIAGGCILALCCDWSVGADSPRARIGLNEVALGLRFPARILRVLRHCLPQLDRVVLQAGLHSPAKAYELGLLDELASPEDSDALARKRLEELAAHPADGYAAAKASLRNGVSASDPAEEAAFLAEVVPVWTSDAVMNRVKRLLGR